MIESKLPDTLSQTVYTALCDMAEVEADSEYKVWMSTWHSNKEEVDKLVIADPKHGKARCYVCFAGAVMAKTFEIPQTQTITPSDFEDNDKLYALDHIREGNIQLAIRTFHDRNGLHEGEPISKEIDKKLQTLPYTVPVNQYEDDPVAWREDMHEIIKKLVEAGL